MVQSKAVFGCALWLKPHEARWFKAPVVEGEENGKAGGIANLIAIFLLFSTIYSRRGQDRSFNLFLPACVAMITELSIEFG